MNNTTRLISPPEMYVLTVITSVQIFIGSILNAAVVVTTSLGKRHNKAAADIMVINLSVADLIPCLSYLPWLTFQLINGFHEEPREYYFMFSFSFALHCSENAVLTLTMDRYIAICFPLRYNSIMTRKIALFLTIWSWIFAFTIAVVSLVSSYLGFQQEAVLAFCVVDYLAMTSILVLNGILFHQARAQAKKQSVGDVIGSKEFAIKHKKMIITVKSAYKTIVISLLYLITFLPCSAVFFATWNDNLSWQKWFFPVSSFTFLNSCINPFVYSFGNSRFRKMFYRVINLMR